MIPKKIHTFWLSEGTPAEFCLKNMETWKQCNPDYDIVLHRSPEFEDLKSVPYYNYTIQCNKWAYASDYLRCKVLYEEGGWYMDADVVCHKSLDELCKEYPRKCYYSYEAMCDKRIECAVLGFEAGNELIKTMKSYYESWYNKRMVIIPELINKICPELIDKDSILDADILSGVFNDGNILSTERSYTTHLFTHTGY